MRLSAFLLLTAYHRFLCLIASVRHKQDTAQSSPLPDFFGGQAAVLLLKTQRGSVAAASLSCPSERPRIFRGFSGGKSIGKQQHRKGAVSSRPQYRSEGTKAQGTLTLTPLCYERRPHSTVSFQANCSTDFPKVQGVENGRYHLDRDTVR